MFTVREIVSAEELDINESNYLQRIDELDSLLREQYDSIVKVDVGLNRQLVSFQANKNRPFYRWYKYKEGFSAELVINYIEKHGINKIKKILDPFAGSGAALFAASSLGIDSVGIELLPIGHELIKTRNLLVKSNSEEIIERIGFWIKNKPWQNHNLYKEYNVLKITKGAYSHENDYQIKKFLSRMETEKQSVQSVLLFALLCILENVSFTRKDGQYLRWDQRSGRCLGAKPFDKGDIKQFDTAIIKKLEEIVSDVKGENDNSFLNFEQKKGIEGQIEIISGSCLDELPNIPDNTIDMVITSPPYCNRYDYTRTYALELAMLGTNEDELIKLRQKMLSCTVENKEKDLLRINPDWSNVLSIVQELPLLQEILKYLMYKKNNKTINNNGLPRMIKGYFYEMACVVYELFRVLKKDGQVIMVNDNVRYAGASISVDLILSDIARQIGFEVEEIAVLPIGKGNSSQQMGVHGRESLRKCIYNWRKN